MKKVLLSLAVAGLVACGQSKEAEKVPANPLDFASLIDSAYLHKHLSIIASDSLQGRDTGSEGLEKAADYIIREYKRLGVKPGAEDSSYLQPVEFKTSRLNSVSYTATQIIKEEAKPATPKKGAKAAPVAEPITFTTTLSADSDADIVQIYGGDVSFKAEVIFAGFGATDSSRGVRPYDGVDVKDKWVLAFLDMPTIVNGDTLLSPSINNNTRFREIIMGLGAKGILAIPSTDARFERNATMAKASVGKPSGMQLAYLSEDNELNFSYNLIRPSAAMKLLGLADTTALKAKYDEMVSSIKTFKAAPINFELEISVDRTPVPLMSSNVIGIIEGSDPVLKNEYVVLSAHYDHVGVGNPDASGDTIYNGADDDGSGTVGLLGVAEALMNAKNAGVGPKRSIMILHVTAEEKGLLGSRFYSDHPTVPIAQTIANVNVDMIGRIDDEYIKTNNGDYVYIIGGSIISSAMDSLLQSANGKLTKINLDMKYNDLNDRNQFYRRSDHWNFGRLGIPFSFFFNGVHPDYHRPSDHVEKIAFQAYAKRSQLVYTYALELGNMNGRPVVDNQEFIEKTKQVPR